MSDDAPKKPKSKKKLLVIILVVVLVLVLGAGGALFFLKQRADAAAAEEDGESSHEVAKDDKKAGPPTFMPIDNMVVNLADPGGDRFAQIGITFEVEDAHAADELKAYLPSVRSAILLIASQRTSEELLKVEGKQKLAEDIQAEAGRPFGFGPGSADKKATKKKDAKHATNPVKKVHFSSFIIQ